MNSSSGLCHQVFHTADVYEKLQCLEKEVKFVLVHGPSSREFPQIPVAPRRDVPVVRLSELPPKLGFSEQAGHARLLHDLASIELQAMELSLRTLYEYPDAPLLFREELALLTLSEGQHLRLCLNALSELNAKWGDWPVHLSLWNAVNPNDTLAERILLVHRHLEGSGLDAGESILRRLDSGLNLCTREVVRFIMKEEVDHVRFGSHWFREICRIHRVDPETLFKQKMPEFLTQIPRRERIARGLREQAGFSDFELGILTSLRSSMKFN